MLDDDALILCLDDLPGPVTQRGGPPGEGAGAGTEAERLLQRNAELQEQLEQLARQFATYRDTVHMTLDQRWGVDDADPPSSLKKPAGADLKDDSEYYWESYAGNGT